jgi:PAS domain S-box-containing protein
MSGPPDLTDELRWSEARYRTLAMATAQIIWTGPPDGGVADVSDSWTAVTGHPKEAALGRRFLELIPDPDRERFVEPWRRALAEGREFEAEFRLRHADGRLLHMRSRSMPVRDVDGSVHERIGALTDLTAEKAAEAARRASQELFIKAFYRSSLAKSIREQGGGPLLDVNDAFLALTGYAREEILGTNGRQIAWLDPADVARFTEDFRAGRPIREAPATVRRQSGERADVLIWVEAIELGGRPCLLTSLQDVTERVRAEAALRDSEELFHKAFELSPIAMTIRDNVDGQRLIRANQAYFELTGYNREELLGTLPGAVALYLERPKLVERLRAMHDRGEEIRDIETQLRRKSGEIATVQIRSEEIEVGGRPCALSTLSDITARVAAERALVASEARLRRSQKLEALGQLAGGIAHDFNNLLTVINGYGGRILEMEGDPGQRREDAEEILKAGERAAALTRQLLAFSRRQILEPRIIDLNAVVLDIEKMLRRVIGEPIAMVTKLDPGLGSTFADPGQIEQVIMNLAINARDAMPDGGTLTIETGNVECAEPDAARRGLKPGAYVALTVCDTGIGMDEETVARMFEPFFTTKESGRGTGLGLATVYGIIMQSGGAIVADSTPGRGTSMRVFLPRSDKPASHGAHASGMTSKFGSETILLVEDEHVVRHLMEELLHSAGYHVLPASSGEAALALVRGGGPRIDLVVTDVVMPGINGVELVAQLRQILPRLKALYVSGYPGTSDWRPVAFEPGAVFLQKPFTRPILTEKVREVLEAER